MTRKILTASETLLFILMMMFSWTTHAQGIITQLPSLGYGQAITGKGDTVATTSTFSGGISVNGTLHRQSVEQTLSNTTRIEGEITVDPAHVGQRGSLVVYAGFSPTATDEMNQFYMLDKNGNIQEWDRNPAHLVSFTEEISLPSTKHFILYRGTFYLPGFLRIFFGYRLTEGTVVTTAEGMNVSIKPAFKALFESSDCPVALFPYELMYDVKCGYVTVPERYIHPEGTKIRLAIAMIPRIGELITAIPLVMEQGGPGGSTLETFVPRLTDILSGDSIVNLRQGREIVLIEQRGTLYSEPFLRCTEFDESDELAATAACYSRLSGQNIQLSAYHTFENATDIVTVMQALGYQSFDFYGVSYGTTLGQQLMNAYPHVLHSVILDGVVPTQVKVQPKMANTIDHAFRLLFNRCTVDSACNLTFPQLETVFFDTVARLNRQPALLQVEDPDGLLHRLFFNGDDFVSETFQMLYSTEAIPHLPKIIYAAYRGDYSTIEKFLPYILFDRTFSEGMYLSTVCAEDANFTEADYELDNLYPQVVTVANGQDIRQSCQGWPVEPLAAYTDEAITSDIPTLLLSGEFDPVTPSYYAEIAAKQLHHAYLYTFPGVSHGTIGGRDCPASIMRAFLDNPNQFPSSDCVAQMTLQFVTDTKTRSQAISPEMLKPFVPPHPPWLW